MRILSSVLMLILGLSGVHASAAGLECTTQSHAIDFLTLEKIGGQDTVVLHYLSEETDNLSVIKNENGTVVAVKNDGPGVAAAVRGVTLNYNTSTGKGTLAINGNILAVDCQPK